MPWLIANLLGFGGWLRKAATGVVGWIGGHPWQGFSIALCALLAWQIHGKHTAQDQRDAARGQIAAMTKASDENAAAQKRQRDELQARYDKEAKDADTDYKAKLADADDRGGTYAERMRFDKLCGKRPAPTGQTQTAQGGDRPAPNGDDIVVSRPDYDAMIANTAQLQAVWNWGQKLIADGVAEPGE